MSVIPTSSTQPIQPSPQKIIIYILLSIFIVGIIALTTFGWKQSLLFVIGGLFGISLYHASFGFASSFRNFFIHREINGVLAQVLMLSVATVLFLPFLIKGSLFGQPIRGALAPVAVQGAIGSFLFGIGMQLGSGCACGTLYTIGGGSSIMLVTLLTFGIGSFWGSLSGNLWASLPKLEPISLAQSFGWAGGLLQLLILGLITLILLRWPGQVKKSSLMATHLSASSLVFGPWPPVLGAIALAVLNWLTLLLVGRPWGVTWGFTLWTAKIAQALGWNPSSSDFWKQGTAATALSQSVFADVTSVMNFGVVLGAALAAALAGRLAIKRPASRLAIFAALIGGLMMGYGARLAFGCNVGAYFGGIASTSLHGWLWIVFALLGTGIGVKLRSFFYPSP